ncbi:MAG: biotin--[acetyl-CoA-carboxylase] ligase [Bacteroidia bacterium]|nr:biotin--[acetyl-CoA-carboxylase] ligase [Bacteroidia bacterium]
MKLSVPKIIVLQEVDSTNNYARQLVVSNAAVEGTVVLAHYQHQGRGQMGNHWESERNRNLTFSVVFYPDFLEPANQFFLSQVVSLGILSFVSGEVAGVKIKWPNDIYVGNRKIGGILIENSVQGRFLFSSIAGMGININQEVFLSDAPNPVSLKQLTGKNYPVEDLARQMVSHIFHWYEKLKCWKFEEIESAYISHLFRMGEWSVFRANGVSFEARIVGIGEFGQLMLEDRSGKITGYLFKEVEFVI